MRELLGRVTCADCLEGLRGLPDNAVSLCVTDPPYEWGFMGKKWDSEPVAAEVWHELLRVLKPGASCFVCVGARQDVVARRIVQLADAGFDVQHSSLFWVFANGNMPKALNVSKDFDKAAFDAWCKALCEAEELELIGSCAWADRHRAQGARGVECGECRRRAWALAAGHERRVTRADLRKAASAAVGGCYAGTGANGKAMQNYGGANPRPWRQEAQSGYGTAVLRALVERFGPAPGVREKAGEKTKIGGRRGQGHFGDGGVFVQPACNPITAPSTPLAQQWDGWYAGAVPLKPMVEVILWAT